MQSMTNDQIRELCEETIIPRLGEPLHKEFAQLHETLETLTDTLLRIADRVDEIALDLNVSDNDEER